MKAILLLSAILFATPSFANRERSAQNIIRTFGYTCDKVDSIQPFLIGEGFHVYCNNFRYHFEIHNKGGKISVVVK